MIDTGKSLHWWFAERSEVMKEKGKETSSKTSKKWVDIEKKEGKTNDNVTCNNTNCQFSFTDRRNGNDKSSSMIAGLAFAQGKKMIVFISFPDRFSKHGGEGVTHVTVLQ